VLLRVPRPADPSNVAAVELPEIAVIVPVYNGRAMLVELCRRLVAALGALDVEFIIVLVDDAGPDQPWPVIREIGQQDPRIKGIRLSRNFGQHYALTAGIDFARANWYVIMDCDLQDAPEDIPLLYAKALEGHEMVAGIRRKEGHGVPKRLGSRVFYSAFSMFSGIRLDWSVGNFRIFSDRAATGFRAMREQLRFVPASFEWMGFDPVYLELPHYRRAEGKSSYSLSKLIRLAVNAILAHSQMPLKIVAGFGFVMSVITFTAGLVYFGQALIYGNRVQGWASIFVTILFVGSIQIAMMGILGIYIGKTFEEAKGRPLYVVKDTINLST
jgi:polyisoprenyl-phosphate glycosyltransferase